MKNLGIKKDEDPERCEISHVRAEKHMHTLPRLHSGPPPRPFPSLPPIWGEKRGVRRLPRWQQRNTTGRPFQWLQVFARAWFELIGC